MIPQGFNQHGILPEGIHECSAIEAAKFLCSNAMRQKIWTGFENFIAWTQYLPRPTAFLVDGSFVTDKPIPNDIDVVVDLTACHVEDQKQWYSSWSDSHEYVKDKFNVDFYPFAAGNGNDFSAFFQYVRVEDALARGISPTVRKGILRVQI